MFRKTYLVLEVSECMYSCIQHDLKTKPLYLGNGWTYRVEILLVIDT